MRYDSSIYYATDCVDYERIPNGKRWDDPSLATPSGGNLGVSVRNVRSAQTYNYPVGPGYWLQSNSIGVAGTSYSAPVAYPGGIAGETLAFPHGLRFSGFNINDPNITGDCVVTNLKVIVQYSDYTVFSNDPDVFIGKGSGVQWCVLPYKPDGVPLSPKLFGSQYSGSTKLTKTLRIPCMKDQSWATNTFKDGIIPDTSYKGQSRWPSDIYVSGKPAYVFEAFESPAVIKPLTVGEINHPNFHIDLICGLVYSASLADQLTVYSVGISVEYIKPYIKSATLWTKGIETEFPYSTRTISWKPDSSDIIWTQPTRSGGTPNATSGSNGIEFVSGASDSYINIFNSPIPENGSGNANAPIKKFDTQLLYGKLPAISNVDTTKNAITDIILDVRVNGATDNSYLYFHYVTVDPQRKFTPAVKWTYWLLNGVFPSVSTTTGEQIYTHYWQAWEPGIRQNYSVSGQNWLPIYGGINNYDSELYSVEANWTMKHYPFKRNNATYGLEGVNSGTFPGQQYDPYWIEKALKNGNLYVGIVFTVDPGIMSEWNKIPHPSGYLRVDGFGLRIKYNEEIQVVESSSVDGLLYRFTP